MLSTPELKRMYIEEGLSVNTIAKKLDAPPSTIRGRLIRAGVYYPRAPGRPLQGVCKRGHDQTTHRRNSRCGKCKELRARGLLDD